MTASSDWEVDLETISAILFDEMDSSTQLSPKAFHKITYFINNRLQEQGIDTTMDYFWYKFGTMTVTQGSSITIDRSDKQKARVRYAASPSALDIPNRVEKGVREVTQNILDKHDSLGTEGLTDAMYTEAPYEFQQRYRELDTCIQNQLRESDDSTTVFNREEIHGHLHDFIEAFPEKQFPDYQNDLYLWYDILSNLLNTDDTTLGEIEDVTEIFWTVIMIDLATDPETGVDESVFKRELGVTDPEQFQESLRSELRRLEDDILTLSPQPSFVNEAADAVMASRLDFVSL